MTSWPGTSTLDVTSTEMDLAKVEHLHAAEPTLAGTVRLALDVAAKATDVNGKTAVQVSRLNANVTTNELQTAASGPGARRLGREHKRIEFELSLRFRPGEKSYSPRRPVTADRGLSDARVTDLQQHQVLESRSLLVDRAPDHSPAFDALVEGNASAEWAQCWIRKRLQANSPLNRLAISSAGTPSATGGATGKPLTVENEGPVSLTYRNQVVDVQQFKLRGPATKVDVAGAVDLKDNKSPMNITASANLDLGSCRG